MTTDSTKHVLALGMDFCTKCGQNIQELSKLRGACPGRPLTEKHRRILIAWDKAIDAAFSKIFSESSHPDADKIGIGALITGYEDEDVEPSESKPECETCRGWGEIEIEDEEC